MRGSDPLHRRQSAVVFVSLLFFNLVLFMIQLWLFVAVLEAALAGRTGVAIPAAVASLVILALNVWMLRGVFLVGRNR